MNKKIIISLILFANLSLRQSLSCSRIQATGLDSDGITLTCVTKINWCKIHGIEGKCLQCRDIDTDVGNWGYVYLSKDQSKCLANCALDPVNKEVKKHILGFFCGTSTTVAGCHVYNLDETCARCRSGMYLHEDGDRCVSDCNADGVNKKVNGVEGGEYEVFIHKNEIEFGGNESGYKEHTGGVCLGQEIANCQLHLKGSDGSKCQRCQNGFYLNFDRTQCVSDCSGELNERINQFNDKLLCVKQETNCIDYDVESRNCNKCDSTYLLTEEFTCVQDCSTFVNKKAESQYKAKCVQEIENCGIYDDDSEKCLVCKTDFYLSEDGNSCISDCSTQPNMRLNFKGRCIKPIDNCLQYHYYERYYNEDFQHDYEIVYNEQNGCKICEAGYYRTQDFRCIQDCTTEIPSYSIELLDEMDNKLCIEMPNIADKQNCRVFEMYPLFFTHCLGCTNGEQADTNFQEEGCISCGMDIVKWNDQYEACVQNSALCPSNNHFYSQNKNYGSKSCGECSEPQFSDHKGKCINSCTHQIFNGQGLGLRGKKACVKTIDNCKLYGKEGICNQCENTHFRSQSRWECLTTCEGQGEYKYKYTHSDGFKYCSKVENCIDFDMDPEFNFTGACKEFICSNTEYKNDDTVCRNDCLANSVTKAKGKDSDGKNLCVNPIDFCDEHGQEGFCVKCQSDKYLSEDQRSCYDDCNSNANKKLESLDQNNTKICAIKIVNCELDGIIDKCTKCENGYFVQVTASQPDSCQLCANNALICIDQNNASKCKGNYDPSTNCVNCLQKYEYDVGQNKCLPTKITIQNKEFGEVCVDFHPQFQQNTIKIYGQATYDSNTNIYQVNQQFQLVSDSSIVEIPGDCYQVKIYGKNSNNNYQNVDIDPILNEADNSKIDFQLDQNFVQQNCQQTNNDFKCEIDMVYILSGVPVFMPKITLNILENTSNPSQPNIQYQAESLYLPIQDQSLKLESKNEQSIQNQTVTVNILAKYQQIQQYYDIVLESLSLVDTSSGQEVKSKNDLQTTETTENISVEIPKTDLSDSEFEIQYKFNLNPKNLLLRIRMLTSNPVNYMYYLQENIAVSTTPVPPNPTTPTNPTNPTNNTIHTNTTNITPTNTTAKLSKTGNIQEEKAETLSTGAILGISAGGSLSFFVIFRIFYHLYKKSKQSKQVLPQNNEIKQTEVPNSLRTLDCPTDNQIQIGSNQDIEVQEIENSSRY